MNTKPIIATDLINHINDLYPYKPLDLKFENTFISERDGSFRQNIILEYTDTFLNDEDHLENDEDKLEKLIPMLIKDMLNIENQPSYTIPHNPTWVEENRYLTKYFYLVDGDTYQDPDYPNNHNPFSDQIHSIIEITCTDTNKYITITYLAQ